MFPFVVLSPFLIMLRFCGMIYRDRYSLRNGPWIDELKALISDCKQRGRSVSEYYGELHTLWDELASAIKLPNCKCSATCEYHVLLENEKLHQFLIGLDSYKYGAVASSLLMLDPLPTISYAHGKVLSTERHQTITNTDDSRVDVVGFAVSNVHCGRKGHEKDKCFELIGWPEWAGSGGRGFYGGHNTGRGGRASGRASGRGHGGFAAAMDSSRQSTSNGLSSDIHRNSVPTLSDAQ
ncbi:Septation ring formation regulator EzrA, partial [Bienertia sinuspersici]